AQEFRRFVAAHHPDRGGDPEVFRAGVAAWRSRQAGAPSVVFYRKLSRRARLLARLRRLPYPPHRGGPTSRRVR
ncbi:MAG: hypothetical protein M3486_00015, partial [Actinomycetota bacterium]|nr:hypothetical protein [Actinomycetota bacterium]